MSNSPAEKSLEPAQETSVRLPLARVRLSARVRLTDRSPAQRKRRLDRRWGLTALMVVGLLQGVYFLWAGRSALAAAPVFRADRSCTSPMLDYSRRLSGDACRLELASVLAATYRSGRSGRTYWVATVTSDGTRSDTPLAGSQSIALWRRLHPTQRIVLQRFVAPGYYLTGQITAIGDSVGAAMTRYHPDSGTHYEGVWSAVGFLLFGCSLVLLRPRRV
jgi:hypothetical protein